MNKFLPFCMLMFTSGIASAQLGIGTNTANPNAVLDLTSTTKGFLPPRMTETQRLALTPADGLLVFQTNNGTGTAGLYAYSTANASWTKVGSGVQNITGGTINGVTITNSPISGATGAFTNLTSSGTTTLAMPAASSATELVVSNGGVLQTRSIGSLNNSVTVATDPSLVGNGTTTPLGINLANPNTYSATQALPANAAQGNNLAAAINTGALGNVEAEQIGIGLTDAQVSDNLTINTASPATFSGGATITGGSITNATSITGSPISGSTGSFTTITGTALPASSASTNIVTSNGGALETRTLASVTDVIQANNGLTRVGNNIQLGGANPLIQPTNINKAGNQLTFSGAGNVGFGTAAPTNQFQINAPGVTGADKTTGQGLNVVATAAPGTSSNAIVGQMNQSTGAVQELRAVNGETIAVNAGTIVNGNAAGGVFSTILTSGAALGANGSTSGVIGSSFIDGNTAASNTAAGGVFAATAGTTMAASSVGVIAAAENSTTRNLAILAIANDKASPAQAYTGAAFARAADANGILGGGAAIAAINGKSNASGKERAIYSDGPVQLRQLGPGTPTSLVGIDAAGNLSATAIPTPLTGGNGINIIGSVVSVDGTDPLTFSNATVTGGAISGTPISGSTGAFTTLSASGTTTLALAPSSSATEIVTSAGGVLQTRSIGSLNNSVGVLTNGTLVGNGTTGNALGINTANSNTYTAAQLLPNSTAQGNNLINAVNAGTAGTLAAAQIGNGLTDAQVSDNLTVTNSTLTGNTITTGSINNTPVGAGTASTGAFTTLSANGATTLTGTTVNVPNITGTAATTLIGRDAGGNLVTTPIPATITASNGLTKNVNDIQLGGTLTQNTTITGGNFNTTFTSTNAVSQTAGFNIIANPGVAITPGNEVFGAVTSLQGSDGIAPNGATETVLRAAVNQATAAGGANAGHTRAQGSLNQGTATGFGLGSGVLNIEQAIGATGLGFYQSGTNATQNDYVVGLLGTTLSPNGGRISAINVEASTADGNFYRSVGGYFRPTGGSTGNLGVVSQIGGTKNSAWKDASLNNRNIAVVAVNTNTPGANERAILSNGAVQMTGLTGAGTNLMTIDGAGNVGTTPAPAVITADNGLTKTGSNIQLGGALIQPTTITTTAANNLNIVSVDNAISNRALSTRLTPTALSGISDVSAAEFVTNYNVATNTAGSNGAVTGARLDANTQASDRQAQGGVMRAQSTSGTLGIEFPAVGGIGIGSGAGLGPVGATTKLVGLSGGVEIQNSGTNWNGVGVEGYVNYNLANSTSGRTAGGHFDGTGGANSATGNGTEFGAIATIEDGGFYTTFGSLTGMHIALAATNYRPAGPNQRAIYSSGAVQMTNLGTGTPTSVVGIDAAGNLSATAIPVATTASNGLTVVGNDVRLGTNPLTNPTEIPSGGNYLALTGASARLGVGTATLTAPTTTLQVNGSMSASVRTGTLPTEVIAATDYLLILTNISTTTSVTLPAATSFIGRMLFIKNNTGSAVTISAYVNSAGTAGTTAIPNGTTLHLVSDGTNWQATN